MTRPKIIFLVVLTSVLAGGCAGIFFILKNDAAKELIVPDDHATITEAVEQARPGQIVLVRGGIYEENVVLKSDVVLKGETDQEIFLRGYKNGATVRISDCNNVSIENIHVEYIQSDPDNEAGNGIDVKDSNVEIINCKLEKAKNGIEISGSSKVQIQGCVSSGNSEFGIFASDGASVSIADSIFENNELTGFAAFDCREVSIENCTSSGHVYMGFESKNTESTCVKNSKAFGNGCGISVYADEAKYKTIDSYAEVVGNIVTDNNKKGISVSGRRRIIVRDNVSSENSEEGIFCYNLNEGDNFVDESQAAVINNSAEGNGKSGISVYNIDYSEVVNNTCKGNGKDGLICYGVNDQSGGELLTKAQVSGNVCSYNSHNGIAASNITSTDIRDNIVYGNEKFGITCYQSSKDIAAGTEVKMNNNISTANGKTGIVTGQIFDVLAEGNRSVGNREFGFILEKSSKVKAEGNISDGNDSTGLIVSAVDSEAVVVNNYSNGNGSNGIKVEDAMKCIIEGNDCWNSNVGIAVVRISSLAEVQSNRCWENKSGGIWCYDSCQADIALNNCIENGNDGISCKAVKRFEVFDNTCTKNESAGIRIFENSSGNLKRNVCRGNFAHGISLYKTNKIINIFENSCLLNGYCGINIYESPEAYITANENEFVENFNWGVSVSGGGRVEFADNICEDNKFEGLFVEGSGTKVDARNNTFKGNYATGILYKDGAEGRIESNVCVNHEWSGMLIKGKGTNPEISKNKLLGNGCWGIAYLGGARPIIKEDNFFEGNGFASIRLDLSEGKRVFHLPYLLIMEMFFGNY